MTERVSLSMVLRRRRRQLELTQAQVAAKAGCRANYVGYIESGQRRPSHKLLFRLADALDLDPQELFLIAFPAIREVVAPKSETRATAWEHFKKNKRLHTRHGVTKAEIDALKSVAMLGPVRSQRDFLFILQTIRQALTDE